MPPPTEITDEVMVSIRILTGLEAVWPTAQRNRVVLQEFLKRNSEDATDESLLGNLDSLYDGPSLFPFPNSPSFDSTSTMKTFWLNEYYASMTGVRQNKPNSLQN